MEKVEIERNKHFMVGKTGQCLSSEQLVVAFPMKFEYEEKPVKIPWDASDFDREQPVFLKKIITSIRFGVRYYSEEQGVRLLGHNYSYDYKELSEKFTLLDGTELYKDADD